MIKTHKIHRREMFCSLPSQYPVYPPPYLLFTVSVKINQFEILSHRFDLCPFTYPRIAWGLYADVQLN